MHKFKNIYVGDLFNTNTARWVKTSDAAAICVVGTTLPKRVGAFFSLGDTHSFGPEADIVLLWSRVLKTEEDTD